MTLLEQCEPLFEYLCRLNQLGRGQASGKDVPEDVRVRERLQKLFADLRKNADEEVYTDAVEHALWALADGIVSECQLPWAEHWDKRGFASDSRRLTNLDQEFWDGLELTLAERESEPRQQRLEVYAACLGLGYDIMYQIEPQYPAVMKKIWTAIGPRFESRDQPKLTPEAYEQVNTDSLAWEPKVEIFRYAALLVVTAAALLAGQVVLYYKARANINDSANAIINAITDDAMQSAGATR